MNFVGHAASARWQSESPTFALGAMLPDFATMCQAKLAPPDDPELDAGVAYHHLADAAFHRLPAFLALYRDAEKRLREAGAARGPARGAAHVAIELFLDGELLERPGVAEHYLAALERGAPSGEVDVDLDGWHRLHARLVDRGVPHGYREPDKVTQIVTYILGRRPLLVPSPACERAIGEEMPALRERVAAEAAGIMSALRRRLGG